MISAEQVELIKAKYEALKAELDERSRRLWSAVEANSLGYGGIVAMAQATRLSESTIRLGQQELKGQLGSVGTIQERGRHISIEIIDLELGDQELIQNAPLLAMIYDRPGKGDNLAIEVGIDEMTYGHTVDSPMSVTTGQNSNGEIIAIQIADSARRKILVNLQAS